MRSISLAESRQPLYTAAGHWPRGREGHGAFVLYCPHHHCCCFGYSSDTIDGDDDDDDDDDNNDDDDEIALVDNDYDDGNDADDYGCHHIVVADVTSAYDDSFC